MMTIVTTVRLKEGAEQEWDAVMRERLAAARKRTGWVGGQLLRPENEDDARVIVGTWHSKQDWAEWHEDPEFAETRERLDGLSRQEPQHSWHEVVDDERRTGSSSSGEGSRKGPRPRRARHSSKP
jgi:heme-degrading monooxygenase HmoA